MSKIFCVQLNSLEVVVYGEYCTVYSVQCVVCSVESIVSSVQKTSDCVMFVVSSVCVLYRWILYNEVCSWCWNEPSG